MNDIEICKNRKPLVIGDITLRLPLIQGGMGVGISLSGLAGAVGLAGGMGIISTAQIGYREPDFETDPIAANLRQIAEQIRRAKEIARGGVIGVNIMTATRSYEKYVCAAVKAGADVIISGAGLPVNLPKYVKGAKTKIAPIVSSLKSARVICRMWERKHSRVPDFVVIEGPEAGGHLGFKEEDISRLTPSLYEEEIRSIISYIKELGEKWKRNIPVITAGGIYTRADVSRQFELGADGVQIGTRFVTTHECDAHPAYKQAYLDAGKEDIQIVKSPVGMPGRAIGNAFLKAQKGGPQSPGKCHQCLQKCDRQKIPYCISGALIEAVKGNVDNGLIFCGNNAWRSNKMESVKDVIGQLF